MGDYHMPITHWPTRMRSATLIRAWCWRLVLTTRSPFVAPRAAQTLDPTCAMCFWGEALATGPNINVTSNGKAVMTPLSAPAPAPQ